VGKSGVLEDKDRGKDIIEAYRSSPTLFRMVPFQDWGLQPPPKTPIATIRMGKATDFKFGW